MPDGHRRSLPRLVKLDDLRKNPRSGREQENVDEEQPDPQSPERLP